MAELSSKQRSHLRSIAHPLRPVFQIGKEGVTISMVRALRQAFNRRELVKVRVLDGAPAETRDAATQLADAVGGADVVQIMGRNITLYRPHPEFPQIRLPA
jgi:RNA-binding protein